MKTNITVRAVGSLQKTGALKKATEDFCFYESKLNLFGVVDGFGGVGIGDVAAKELAESVKSFYLYANQEKEVTLPFLYRSGLGEHVNLLLNASLVANESLIKRNQSQKSINQRAGASAAMAKIEHSKLYLSNIGSCSAFLIRNGRSQAIVRPQSYNHYRGVFPGSWSSKWAIPTHAYGLTLDVEPQLIELQIESRDLVVLSTDGVYPHWTESDLSQAAQQFLGQVPSESSGHALDKAVNAFNEHLESIARDKNGEDDRTLLSIFFI